MRCKFIIVDDEPPAIKILEKYAEDVGQLELVGTCNNAFEAIRILNEKKIDLMFLDINMPKLMGTQLIKSLRYPPKVIFTTAHADFAIEAFELDAVDYLLKPISFERFLKAVNKFCHLNHVEMDFLGQTSAFLYFRSDRKMIKVLLEDIVYIESMKDYILIHRQNNADLKVKQTLSETENMLPPHLFLRIHRSFIVSVKKITAFTNYEIEIGKIELPIGRSYAEAFDKLSPDNNKLP